MPGLQPENRGAGGRVRPDRLIGPPARYGPAMAEDRDVVTVERTIPAPAEAIFALLRDPTRHREIDGSGTVRDAKGETEPLVLGSRFGMSMKMGLPYSMVSTV